MMVQVVAAFFVTVFFAITFHCAKHQLIYTGFSGAMGWLAFLLVHNQVASVVLASFIGALVVSIAAGAFSSLRAAPITVFQIPGIIPLVPGKGMYDTLNAILLGDNEATLYHLFLTLQIAGAIAIAMMVVYTLRTLLRPKKKQLP